jgi:biopolymer transport protein ExbD
MQFAGETLGELEYDQLVTRRPPEQDAHFDITAMVDLVFMMNIYFLVTFITVALAEVNLPAAANVTALDADTAVMVTIKRSLDGRSADVYLTGDAKGTPLRGAAEQERGVQTLVDEGLALGKTAVLIKAEKNVRLGDMFRIATAASAEGVTLHVAVLEKDAEQ